MVETPRDSLTAQMISCATLLALVVGRLLVHLEADGGKESREFNEFNE